MAENKLVTNVGTSKHYGILDRYNTDKSRYSTQDGNALLGGANVIGGFNAENTYVEKFVGGDGTFGAGRSIPRQEMEVFQRISEVGDKPWREAAVNSN